VWAAACEVGGGGDKLQPPSWGAAVCQP
jgi:hypothetical protein